VKGKVFRGQQPMSHRTVTSATKSARYFGAEYPGSILARRGQATMGRIFDVDAPTIDPVIPRHGEQPDRRGSSKAAEVEANDPSAGLGTNLGSDPLGRDDP
jgi:hypothetical protein